MNEQRDAANREFAYKQMITGQHITKNYSLGISVDNLLKDTQHYVSLVDACDKGARECVWDELLRVSQRPHQEMPDNITFRELYEAWVLQGPTVNVYAIELLHAAFIHALRRKPSLFDTYIRTHHSPSQQRPSSVQPRKTLVHPSHHDLPSSLWGSDLPAALQQLVLFHLWAPMLESLPEDHKKLIWMTCTQSRGFIKYDRSSFHSTFALWSADPVACRENIVTFFGALAYLCQLGAIPNQYCFPYSRTLVFPSNNNVAPLPPPAPKPVSRDAHISLHPPFKMTAVPPPNLPPLQYSHYTSYQHNLAPSPPPQQQQQPQQNIHNISPSIPLQTPKVESVKPDLIAVQIIPTADEPSLKPALASTSNKRKLPSPPSTSSSSSSSRKKVTMKEPKQSPYNTSTSTNNKPPATNSLDVLAFTAVLQFEELNNNDNYNSNDNYNYNSNNNYNYNSNNNNGYHHVVITTPTGARSPTESPLKRRRSLSCGDETEIEKHRHEKLRMMNISNILCS